MHSVTDPDSRRAASARNENTWRRRLARWRGSQVEFDLRPYAERLPEIERLGIELIKLPDAELKRRSRRLAAVARQSRANETPGDGASLDDVARHSRANEILLPRAFALVREAADRVTGMRPFDVQMLAAVALHRGRVVEMSTGEGKTLAAVLPAYLNALPGRGVHVLTVNDYLARRDAEWMGPIYRFLGLTVGWVQEESSQAERRRAYACDVTYVTAKEAGFDLLREHLAQEPEEVVHRPFHFAIVDEARVPLVLAGSAERAASAAPRLAKLVADFEPGVHFETQEYDRNVELTEAGYDRTEQELGCGNLLARDNYALLTELNCALHARVLLRRDADYIVRGGRIELVDEFTGRVAEDRHWPDGLQAALEAKEGLERRPDGRILGSITTEHFLAGYSRLCGMTGTAQAAAEELEEMYGLRVVVIPTHRPMIRDDLPDVVFTHRQAKEQAVIDEVRQVHATGQPMLIGTLTVGESERLAGRLRGAGVACEVLNAKNDAEEAKIVARAGALGAVTISTHMAGRGTDIRLGGDNEATRDQVVALGGLYVIGTNRHESRRVDLQLRGRAGRQGDPGESRFFVSLEDDLLRRYDVESLIPERLLPDKRKAPISSPVVRREVARAQRIIEGQDREIRRTLWRYSKPVEEQRRRLCSERQAVLLGHSLSLWQQDAKRYSALVEAAGEAAVRRAERVVTLHHFDRAWRDHLAFVASLREGIHLVGLGGEHPLTTFQVRTVEAFNRMHADIDAAVVGALDDVKVADGGLDLDHAGLKGPSSTWTYIVTDDPFRHQLGRLLTGPGRTTFAIGAGIVAAPLFILWALVDRFYRKRKVPPGRTIKAAAHGREEAGS